MVVYLDFGIVIEDSVLPQKVGSKISPVVVHMGRYSRTMVAAVHFLFRQFWEIISS